MRLVIVKAYKSFFKHKKYFAVINFCDGSDWKTVPTWTATEVTDHGEVVTKAGVEVVIRSPKKSI